MSPLAYLTFYQNKFNMTLSQNNNNFENYCVDFYHIIAYNKVKLIDCLRCPFGRIGKSGANPARSRHCKGELLKISTGKPGRFKQL